MVQKILAEPHFGKAIKKMEIRSSWTCWEIEIFSKKIQFPHSVYPILVQNGANTFEKSPEYKSSSFGF